MKRMISVVDLGTVSSDVLNEMRADLNSSGQRKGYDVCAGLVQAIEEFEKNLDDQSNRKIVETFLASIPVTETKRG